MTPTEQRMSALARANEVRIENAQVLAEIHGLSYREGMRRVAGLLAEPGTCGALPVYRLLMAPRRIGASKVATILRAAGVVSGDRRVRELSPRQRDMLAGLLRRRAA